ncbi:LiaF domain-containing protein [Butyrivibrio sp. MC2013]|uniref:LiaF domain-containing protein n=1 Tax=Butyrivibrio sp. MC2013 TaxID=1280686 RepID=UPI0004053FDC|nr:LiaF domain-containing protein [Butyrivibrio sp. MC2013]
MKNKNLLMGLLLIIAAAGLLTRNHSGLSFGLWDIAINVCILVLLIKGIIDRSFGKIIFALAFLVIVNKEMLGLAKLSTLTILGAAFLATIGFNLIFPKVKKYPSAGAGEYAPILVHNSVKEAAVYIDSTESDDSDTGSGIFDINNVFNEHTKYLGNSCLKRLDISNVFGALTIHLEEVDLKDNKAALDASNVFGKVDLYVPARYKIRLDPCMVFGSINEYGQTPAVDSPMELTMDISSIFGSVDIHYV